MAEQKSGEQMTDEDNWRKAFEMIGPETLRLRLEHRRNEMSPQYARAAEVWLLEKAAAAARIENTRFNTTKRWTIVAAVAGVIAALASLIAAWPVLKEWLAR